MENKVLDRVVRQRKELILKGIVYVVSIILFFMTLYPFLSLLADYSGFTIKNPANVFKVLPKRWKEFVRFFQSRIALSYVNSMIVTISSTILNVYFSALTAHAVVNYRWRGRKLFGNFVLAMMMIPTSIASSGFITMVYRFHLQNTLSMLIFPAIATPISVVFMRMYLESSFSMELIYSARVDGAGEIRIFHQIVLPIMKPAIATQAIFAMAQSWNDLLRPMILLLDDKKKTMPVALLMNNALGQSDLPVIILTIPLIIAYLLLARHIVEGVQLGSVKM